MLEENTNPVKILLIEDDDIDAELLERSFKRQKIINPICRAYDGLDAYEKLKGHNGQSLEEGPHIIFLDLNMPRMNGIEFLKKVRQDPQLASSIIFVLTTSNTDEEKVQAYQRSIAGYLLKENLGSDCIAEMKNMLNFYTQYITFSQEMEQ